MKYSEIQEIALVYGKKELVEEFLENFRLDRMHDQAPITAILVENEMKKGLKKWIWKGD